MGRRTGIRADSSSSLTIDFRYRGVRCREKLKLPPTPANRAYAEKYKARILHEIAIGTFDYAAHFPRSPRARALARNPASAVTVGELLSDWLRHAKPELEPETFGDYEEYVDNIWRPRFGKDRVCDLTHARVAEWIAEQTTSRKRILNVLTPLRQAMRYAVDVARLLPVDPLAKLKVKRPDVVADDVIDPFTPAEVAAIVAHLPAPIANAVQCWAWTGLRQGELFALAWSDVDLERGVARITKALRDGRQKTPKTRAGVRELRLLDPALDALKAQREHTQLLRGRVFLDPETRAAWAGDKPFRRAFQAACEAAGVRYRFPRQLRHTFASWTLSAGENPLWVSKTMGHRDASITLRVYARFIPDVFPDAGARTLAAVRA